MVQAYTGVRWTMVSHCRIVVGRWIAPASSGRVRANTKIEFRALPGRKKGRAVRRMQKVSPDALPTFTGHVSPFFSFSSIVLSLPSVRPASVFSRVLRTSSVDRPSYIQRPPISTLLNFHPSARASDNFRLVGNLIRETRCDVSRWL